MKFNLIASLVFVCLLFPFRSHASIPPLPINDRLHGGLTTRMNFASLEVDEIPSEYARNITGFSLGVFGVRPLSHALAVQAELLYTRKGGKLEYDLDGLMATEVYRFDYLEWASLFRLNLPVRSDTRFYGELGVVVSFLLSGEGEGTVSDGSISVAEKLNVSEQLMPLELSWAFGAGVAIPISQVGFLLGVRYHMGIFPATYEGGVYSRNLQLQTGIYF